MFTYKKFTSWKTQWNVKKHVNCDRIRYSLTIINNMSTATPQKNIWSKEIKKKKKKKNQKIFVLERRQGTRISPNLNFRLYQYLLISIDPKP